jgi:hypothetical protein
VFEIHRRFWEEVENGNYCEETRKLKEEGEEVERKSKG